MRGLIMALAGALTLTGCGATYKGNQVAFDGKYYKARLNREKDSRARFLVTVAPVSQGFDGAREAGRYEAIKHCIAQYGSSDIDWVRGPDDNAAALPVADDTLSLQGRCKDE